MVFGSIKSTVTNGISSLNPLEKLSAFLPDLPFESLEKMLASFASAFTQGDRLFKLQIGDGKTFGDRLLPQSVEGTEALSACYKYEVTCLSPDAFIPLNSLLGQAAQLDIITGAGGLLDFDAAPEDVTRCGLITKAEALPSDGGFAKYKLTIEPPLALLRHRRTSRVFQDISAPEIVEQIVQEHIEANSAIGAALTLKLDLVRQYGPRSYCLQYRETDLEFIARLLSEEGLAYRFAHAGGDAPATTFIVFDDPYGLPEASQKNVRFHRAEATEAKDSITEWTEMRRVRSGQTSLTSYDYKPVYTHEASEQSSVDQGDEGIEAEASLEDFDAQTLYYAKDADDLTRYAELRQQAHDREKGGYTAQGNLRQLQAGQWFVLNNHPYFDKFRDQEQREFVACSVSFCAHNNLPGEMLKYLQPKPEKSPKPYWVKIETRKRGLPLNPSYAHTQLAKPKTQGVQTATVTGPAEEEVYTDEMGRIKIQFHWQRPKEHQAFGASFDERSSCWVRVVYPGAGDAWGHQSIPRIGQEVLVDFIESDIDRPIVTGVIHNGRQPNPWFSGVGSLPANRALTGIKTKEHHGLQYGELLFDDTQNQVRTKLSSEHGKTQLNQGYLIHPRQDGEGDARGEGFELRSDRHGAIRAGEGLLISTEAKPGATGKQIDRDQAQAQLAAALQKSRILSDAAEHQKADATETGPEERDEEGKKGQKAPNGHLDHLVEAIKAWEAGTNTDPDGKDVAGDQPGKQPVILLSGTEGIGLATPRELVLAAEKNLDMVSQRDTQQTSARRWIHNVGSKISLFVHGIADKVNLKLITAKGHAQMQAQSGDVEITADKNVRINASKQKLTAAAGEELLLNCAGAYIRLKGGNIDIHCPGNASFKSAGHSFSGPASMDVALPTFPSSEFCLECFLKALKAGSSAARV